MAEALIKMRGKYKQQNKKTSSATKER